MKEFISIFLSEYIDKFADFRGRATRKQFWGSYLMLILVNIAITVLSLIVGVLALIPILGTLINIIFGLICFVYSLAIIIPSIAITVRRLHDVNKSGWLYLIYCVASSVILILPVIGVIMLISAAQMGESSGFGSFLIFAGAIGFLAITIYMFYLLVKKSDEGSNRFGEPSQITYFDFDAFKAKVKAKFSKK
ncbi:MAG: DUF805 domain-containing protein [Succinivibrio sp.]